MQIDWEVYGIKRVCTSSCAINATFDILMLCTWIKSQLPEEFSPLCKMKLFPAFLLLLLACSANAEVDWLKPCSFDGNCCRYSHCAIRIICSYKALFLILGFCPNGGV